MKAPSIVIGVGGIGAEICARVMRQMPKNAPDNALIRFAIMDTDVNTIRALHREGFRGIEIQLSDNRTVKNCRESMPTGVAEWYPPSAIFDRKSMTEGAGQQRSISRLAFDYSIRENKLDSLFAAIRELKEVSIDASEQQVRIYVISSLAGGTGSGIILPLALCLNEYIEKLYGDHLAICKGFFVLSSAVKENVKHMLEKQSLDSNAYASVKELDAFMRVADGDRERYKELGMNVPSYESHAYEKYSGSSYEYCYLFGMINDATGGLHSFEELKNQVAKAVYLQACSPIHDRNSSREDNTLKFLTQKMLGKGENRLSRFGGIGCGELEYPYEILSRYYALKRAVSVMEKQWQAYDLEFHVKDVEQRQRKKDGKKIIPVKRNKEYINAIKFADHTDIFAENIRNSCVLDDGCPKWEGYLQALWTEINRQIDEIRQENENEEGGDEDTFAQLLDGVIDHHNRKRRKQMEARNDMIDAFQKLKPQILKISDDYGMHMQNTWFTMHPLIDTQPEFYMEYWLVKNGEFIHPNAVRFFLYNLLDVVETRIGKVENDLKRCRNIFAQRDYDQRIEKSFRSIDRYLRVNFKSEREKYEAALDALYLYVKKDIYLRILKSCRNYAEGLSANYESFYDSYEPMLVSFKEEISLLESRLERTRGIGKAFICSDAVCRECVYSEMQKNINFLSAGAGLSYRIFDLVHKSVNNSRQRNDFNEQIKQFWIVDTEQVFDDLNMNILRAMDRESLYKNGVHMTAEMFKSRIRDAEKKLVAPYLQYEKVAGEEQGIAISCFNRELLEEQDTYKEVVTWMKENDGIDDEYYCDKYRIMFYRSFVGLDVFEIFEYAHGGETGENHKGIAFKFYEKTVREMGKAKGQSAQITPHLDRTWHNILNLPDVNLSYQEKKEIEIGCAFLYSVLSEKFRKKDNGYYDFTPLAGQKEFANMMECHEFLYENQWWEQYLLEQLSESIRVNRDTGSCDLKRSINAYPGGILAILFNYNIEVDIGRQNNDRNNILVKAAKILIYHCLEGDQKSIEAKCKIEMENAWNILDASMKAERRAVNIKNAVMSFYRNNNYHCNEG